MCFLWGQWFWFWYHEPGASILLCNVVYASGFVCRVDEIYIYISYNKVKLGSMSNLMVLNYSGLCHFTKQFAVYELSFTCGIPPIKQSKVFIDPGLILAVALVHGMMKWSLPTWQKRCDSDKISGWRDPPVSRRLRKARRLRRKRRRKVEGRRNLAPWHLNILVWTLNAWCEPSTSTVWTLNILGLSQNAATSFESVA